MQQEIWGWLIVIYLFLGGLGAGAFLASALAYKGLLGKINERFYKFGFLLAPLAVVFGTLLLIFDLAPSAAINPFKLLQLYTRPVSMMSIGTYILTIFIIVSFLAYKKMKKGEVISDTMIAFGSVFAIGVMGYTGLLLYVVDAIPLWASLWLPALFTISAVSTGISANAVATLNAGHGLTHKVHKLHTILVVLELIAVIGLFFAVSGEAAGYKSINAITMGSLAPSFWIGFVILGLIFPLVGGTKHMLVATNENFCCDSEVKSCVFNEMGVLIGGFCLRAFIIFGAFFII